MKPISHVCVLGKVEQTENRHGQTCPHAGSEADSLDPESRRTDPFAPDPRLTPANAQMVNRFESRTGGTGILIAAVLLVLALVAYFAFATGDDTAVAPGDPAVTEQPADATPAPDATAPADPAPADTAPAPDATAPAPTTDPAPAPAPAQ